MGAPDTSSETSPDAPPGRIRRIAILGGGTAGWLAANHLGHELQADPGIEITLIESPDVPIIGVGEGTVPYIKQSLRRFGISEAELLLSCETSFKTGIRFQGWLDAARHGEGHHYLHAFASPYPDGIDLTPFWLAHPGLGPFDGVSVAAQLSEADRCPKQIESGPYLGEVDYAYHVNAHQFAQLLSRHACKRFGVRHQRLTLVGAERGLDGDILAVRGAGGERLAFDFYIDCSGFASVLTHGVLKVPFVDQSHRVLTDTALVQQVPLAEGEAIRPYTLATAHRAGWIWDIPVTRRRGTGFVYASACMSETEAVEAFARYLGRPVDGFEPRRIPMRIGFREQSWHANCVALGLAQGFVEPLEATSILATDFAAHLLARNFPRQRQDQPVLRRHFNQAMRQCWDSIIDFVQLHYHLSDRGDSPFWQDCRHAGHLSAQLQERLEKWRLLPPHATDFPNRFELFNVENYLYVLYGMKYPTRGIAIAAGEAARARELWQQTAARARRLAAQLPSHRDWLDGLHTAAAAR